jgi:hypothetical protein
MESGALPIEEPYEMMTLLEDCFSYSGTRSLRASAKAPEVMTFISAANEGLTKITAARKMKVVTLSE